MTLSHFSVRLGWIETRLSSVLQALTAIMDVADEHITVIDQTTASKAKVTTVEKNIKHLQESIDQLENHSCGSNVRILGIEERKEGTNAVKYLETWIPEYHELDTSNGRIVLERTHRSLAPMPGTGQQPRPLIVKFYYYSVKVREIDAACRHHLDTTCARGSTSLMTTPWRLFTNA